MSNKSADMFGDEVSHQPIVPLQGWEREKLLGYYKAKARSGFTPS